MSGISVSELIRSSLTQELGMQANEPAGDIEFLHDYSEGTIGLLEAMRMSGITDYGDFRDRMNDEEIPWPSHVAEDIEAEAEIVVSAIEGTWGPNGDIHVEG